MYIGLDLSTQQLKAVVIKSDLTAYLEAKVDFDTDLAHYETRKGVLTSDVPGEIFAPVAMWLEAVDLVLERLHHQGLDFSAIEGISGAGMQHGVVFWSQEASSVLGNLDPRYTLASQITPSRCFTHPYSPNWQDSSTQEQCEKFDKVLGSAEELANITGSKAHHRFSGPQILKFYETHRDRYHATARISLVSSFLASVFLGRIAPIDRADACGMNLLFIRGGVWDPRLLTLAAGGTEHGFGLLARQLGNIHTNASEPLGTISPYFAARYGFSEKCSVVSFTGDNPATMLSLPLQANNAIVSLGTSTTFLMSTSVYAPSPDYHVMLHPTTIGLYMVMLCYKNGALAREHVRDALNPPTWDSFDAAVRSTTPLHQAKPSDPMRLGLFLPLTEILPHLPPTYLQALYEPLTQTLTLLGEKEQQARQVSGAQAPRTILESQLLSIRLHSLALVSAPTRMQHLPQPSKVYLVGGGSASSSIARVAGGVLGGPEGIWRVAEGRGANACAMGAAFRAAWACEVGIGSGARKFETWLEGKWREKETVDKVDEGWREEEWNRYGEGLEGMRQLEKIAGGTK